MHMNFDLELLIEILPTLSTLPLQSRNENSNRIVEGANEKVTRNAIKIPDPTESLM